MLHFRCDLFSYSPTDSFPRPRGLGKGFAAYTPRLPNGIPMQGNARPARKAGMGAMLVNTLPATLHR